jgi:hypothetical protein
MKLLFPFPLKCSLPIATVSGLYAGYRLYKRLNLYFRMILYLFVPE